MYLNAPVKHCEFPFVCLDNCTCLMMNVCVLLSVQEVT